MYSDSSLNSSSNSTYIEDILSRPELSRKARHFAHIVSLLWFYYGIGVWFGSRFIIHVEKEALDIVLIFGATLPIWFVALFLYIGIFLAKRSIEGK